MAPPNITAEGTIQTRYRTRKIAQGRTSAAKPAKWRILSLMPLVTSGTEGDNAKTRIVTARISVTATARRLRSFVSD